MADWHHSKEWKLARLHAKNVLEPVCVSCHKELIGNDFTIDHINPPKNTGGVPDHSLENLQAMCRTCNGRKQDRTLIRVTWLNPRWHSPDKR
mgnify:CR=1 FL=1